MKTSFYIKWHCHIHWNVVLAILFSTIHGGGCHHFISKTKFGFNGELQISVEGLPEYIMPRVLCPEDIQKLPLLECEVLAEVAPENPASECIPNSSIKKMDLALKFKSLTKNGFPPIDTTAVQIRILRAQEGGLTNLTKNILQSFTDAKSIFLSKHWFERLIAIDEIFSELKSLQELHLEDNDIASWTISDNMRDDILPELKVLSLSKNPIEFLDETAFKWLKNTKLEFLIIRECKGLMRIDSGILLPVIGSLRYLDLSRCGLNKPQFQNISTALENFNNSNKLEGLSFAQTGITWIPTDILSAVAPSLKYLSLYGNGFNDKPPHLIDRESLAMIPVMEQLEQLDLRANNMKMWPPNCFDAVPNLQMLLIGNNDFFSINPLLLKPLKKLRLLSLTNNSAGNPGANLTLNGSIFEHQSELEDLDMSYSTLKPLTNRTFQGLQSLKTLYLKGIYLESLPDGVFSELTNLTVLDISENKLQVGVSQNAFAGLINLEKLNASSSGLSLRGVRLDHLQNLTLFDLSNNCVEDIEIFSKSNMTKLKYFNLNENKIVTWQQQQFQGIHLQELGLKSNLLNEISPAMMKDFENISIVDASRNPYQCYCSMLNITPPNFLHWPIAYTCQSLSKLIPLQDISLHNCIELKTAYRTRKITESSGNAALVVSIVCGLVLMALAVFCYWKWWHIRICARILHKSALFTLMTNEDDEESTSKDKKYFYDVFVSYSDPDRHWILDHLLPNLEMNNQIKVCLHERDFKAGISILENIMACMDQSRCILLVVSKAFLRSHWCQFELNMAQHRLLEMKRDHLLLVLLESVPREQCSKMMRYLLLTKTYLEWPSRDNIVNKQEEQLFWKRLCKAVGCSQNSV